MKMLSVSASETMEYLREKDMHVRWPWVASEWKALSLDTSGEQPKFKEPGNAVWLGILWLRCSYIFLWEWAPLVSELTLNDAVV
jgi:hypothetical protein